jgi:hypothetical protein
MDVLRKALDADSMASLPEPVGWWLHTNAVGQQYFRKKPQDAVFNPQPLYTAPPLSMTISGDCATSRSSNRREWQGLTHEERDAICKDFVGDDDRVGAYRSLALEVEVRLTEKNK